MIYPRLTAYEERLIAVMGDKVGVAARVLAAWAKLQPEAKQTVKSLTSLA